MISLKDVHFPIDLDSSAHNVAEELFNPGLAASKTYDRGVGFFSSGWLQMVADGLAPFAERGGQVRLIASPHLASYDAAALQEGEKAKKDAVLLEALRVCMDEIEANIKSEPLKVLSWMVADGLLDIKIAVPTADLSGDYHSKVGIFTDQYGDFLVFHGSQNESARGFKNFETLDIFPSWMDDRDRQRAVRHREKFNKIWDQRDANIRCFSLPSAIKKRLIQFTNSGDRPYNQPERSSVSTSQKWRHQAEAVSCFLDKKNGVLEMATGTGKTRTALCIMNELLQREVIDSVVVTTKGTDLLNQWGKTLTLEGPELPIFKAYHNHRDALGFVSRPKDKLLLCSSQKLPELLMRLDPVKVSRTLLVCDEVHGMGSPAMVRDLSGKLCSFEYRLGLSATPEREYDDDGNRFIETEIGPTIYSFGLEDAIKRGVLCEVDYISIRFELSDEDRKKKQEAIRRHEGARARGEIRPDSDLYRDLANVKKLSVQKLKPLSELMSRLPEILDRSLIFVATKEYGVEIQKIVARYNDRFHTYYDDDDQSNLSRFANGELNSLITCHRISEGIDIQSVRSVILVSSDRARLETIQRLGRCLRFDPNDEEKRARVIDFTCTDNGEVDTADRERKTWLENLSRIRRDA